MARSVVLMSGGIASATVAAMAADDGEAVWLFVDYGQRSNGAEGQAVDALAAQLKPARVVRASMGHWASLGEFAILAGRDHLSDAMAIRQAPDPAYLPGLMPSLVSAGLALACNLQAERVLIGLIEERGISDIPTYKLYPDRSRESVAAWNWQYQLACDPAGKTIRLEAPLIASKQGDVALLGHRLGVAFERTWSCYRAGPTPCRRCYGCVARAHGLLQLGLTDPLLAAEVG